MAPTSLILSVRADEVRVGDYTYNSLARRMSTVARQAFEWVRVIGVEQDGKWVRITTRAWDAVKHQGEGVMVRRDAEATS